MTVKGCPSWTDMAIPWHREAREAQEWKMYLQLYVLSLFWQCWGLTQGLAHAKPHPTSLYFNGPQQPKVMRAQMRTTRQDRSDYELSKDFEDVF